MGSDIEERTVRDVQQRCQPACECGGQRAAAEVQTTL